MTEGDITHTDTNWTEEQQEYMYLTVKEQYLHLVKKFAQIYQSDILFQSRLKVIIFCQALELDK